MSADHTLEMAAAHMKFSSSQKMPRVATWTEFIHQFFMLNDLHADGGQWVVLQLYNDLLLVDLYVGLEFSEVP